MTTRNPLVYIPGGNPCIQELPAGDTLAGAATGATGSAGAAATISVGTTTTGSAGTSASVTNSGSSSAAVFNFTIPRGADGTNGINGTGSGANLICNGRLTLTSATPVTTSDVTGATTIYFTPYKGGQASTYDSSTWTGHTLTEVSLALGTLSSGKNYDVFLYSNSGTLTLELSSAWTSDTARNDALALQDGVYVKSADHSRRYLGTFRTTSTTATEDSDAKRFVWNYYNRVARRCKINDATSHTYNSATVRQWRATATNQIDFVLGLQEDAVPCSIMGEQSASTTTFGLIATGLDTTSALSVATDGYFYAMAANCAGTGSTVYFPSAGRHFISANQKSNANVTFANILLTAVISG